MLTYFNMFVFGVIVFCSLAGWGFVVNRVIFPTSRVGIGSRAAWGMAFTIAIGGLLNYAYMVSLASLAGFICVGATIQYADWFQRRKAIQFSSRMLFKELQKDYKLVVALVGILAILSIYYMGSISSTHANIMDDLQGYFVFPYKMLQTGSLGEDPFSVRRIVSLGGNSFLQAIVLTMGTAKNLKILELGLGVLISTALFVELGREIGAPKWGVVGAIYLFLFVPPTVANATSTVTALALFVSLFYAYLRFSMGSYRMIKVAIILGLHIAAICSLKGTYIPHAVLFIAFCYLIRTIVDKNSLKNNIGEGVSTGLIGLIMLLPWMLLLYKSNGTFMYPLLGKGFHGSQYGSYLMGDPVTVKDLFKTILGVPFCVLLLQASALLISDERRRPEYILAMATVAAAATSLILLTGVFGNALVGRYAYSFTFSSIIVVMIVLSAKIGQNQGSQSLINMKVSIIALVSSGILIGNAWYIARPEHNVRVRMIYSGLKNTALTTNDAEHPRLDNKRIKLMYERMQKVLPSGEKLLARLRYPFLLDFGRNEIYIIDMPGGSSPPPGMPVYRGGEALAQYLADKSIRYVAYAYKHEANFPTYKENERKNLDAWAKGEDGDGWYLSQRHHAVDFQSNLMELGQSRARIYDDGEIFVLDLKNPHTQRVDLN